MEDVSMTAEQILDADFLGVRHRLLDLAASLDRAARADGADALPADARWIMIKDALALLLEERTDLAERVQILFSDPYNNDWQKQQ